MLQAAFSKINLKVFLLKASLLSLIYRRDLYRIKIFGMLGFRNMTHNINLLQKSTNSKKTDIYLTLITFEHDKDVYKFLHYNLLFFMLRQIHVTGIN